MRGFCGTRPADRDALTERREVVTMFFLIRGIVRWFQKRKQVR